MFHFYAGLTYHLASVLQTVAGLNVLNALRSLIALMFLACSSGMYLFVRRRSGVPGAVLAGLLYVYSPWLLHTEALARGAYPELLSLAISCGAWMCCATDPPPSIWSGPFWFRWRSSIPTI